MKSVYYIWWNFKTLIFRLKDQLELQNREGLVNENKQMLIWLTANQSYDYFCLFVYCKQFNGLF